jgi:uncharacterized protein YbjT (DUF2867 family)
MILVTAAGGKTGKALINALAAKGQEVRALVRREEQVAGAKALGATEIGVGSMDDPRVLAQAMRGAHAVYHLCPNVSPHELSFAQAAVAAAAGAGIRRFVFHSVLHPQIEAMPHHWAKMRVEEMLLASGMDVTILQPTAYMQNISAGWQSIAGHGVYRVPYPVGTRLSLVDLDDVAEVAALVLVEPGHVGATYELVGTPPLSQAEIAATLSDVLRRPVRAEAEAIEAWDARARVAGMGEYQRATLGRMFRCYEHSGLAGNPNVLRWLLGRAPTTLASFAARAAAGQA